MTHHLEELPTTTTHAMLVEDGRVHAVGPAREVLAIDRASASFDQPIAIEHRAGCWQARALTRS